MAAYECDVQECSSCSVREVGYLSWNPEEASFKASEGMDSLAR